MRLGENLFLRKQVAVFVVECSGSRQQGMPVTRREGCTLAEPSVAAACLLLFQDVSSHQKKAETDGQGNEENEHTTE